MLTRAPLRLWLALALSTPVLFGCGAADESGGSVTRPRESTVEAQPEDKAMAADVQRYFRRLATEVPWYKDIESITVVWRRDHGRYGAGPQ